MFFWRPCRRPHFSSEAATERLVYTARSDAHWLNLEQERGMIEKGGRIRFGVGLLLVNLVSLPTLLMMVGNHRNSTFIPSNHWLWWAFLGVLACGYTISVMALLRRVQWGYCVWLQMVLSFMVLVVYIGWWRREMNFIQGPRDPESSLASPEASWSAYLVILLIALAAGLLPLGIRSGVRWARAKRQRHESDADSE